MSTFLLLLFLASFLFIANAASYTLTGELQSWADGNPGFGSAAGTPPVTTGFPAALNLLGKPTGGSGPGFDNWFAQPIANQAKLTPFSIVMDEAGTTYTFSRTGWTPMSGVNFFSFHVRGEINCGGSCSPLSLTSSDDAAIYIDGDKKCETKGTGTSSMPATCLTSLSTQQAGQWTRYVDIF
eukprot:TRINITY_DN257_c1_g1_i12.p1 TRINITY_DN257_c1_g1~~TRINITY_DN257_c1_g1_i12.p1  ORF type:complete len:182 (+),score=31.25 TRINITY_DN257_c1_g1_i12:99-644(+)